MIHCNCSTVLPLGAKSANAVAPADVPPPSDQSPAPMSSTRERRAPESFARSRCCPDPRVTSPPLAF
jgi:hypothetical protein